MKTLLRVLIPLVVLHQATSAQVSLPADAASSFTLDRFQEHVSFLASDEMRGRNTPSPELEKAADYIADHFERIGLSPLGSFFKLPYQLVQSNLDTNRAQTNLVITRDGVEQSFRLGKDFIPFEATGENPIKESPLSFAGFGITAPEYEYDDYAGIDVKGHVVLVLRGEPEGSDPAKFRGPAFTRFASTSEKIRNARKHGAVGILLIDAVRSTRKPLVTGYTWPSLFPKSPRNGRGLQLPDTVTSVIALHVGEAVFSAVMGPLDSLRETVLAIDRSYLPQSRHLSGVTVSASVKLWPETYTVHNVAGMLKGAKYPDEYVVIGAHYDHVGVGNPDVTGDSIFNGADDNASGTSNLLVASQALAGSSVRPDRSIVFVAFSGEEKGLLGSKAFVAKSPLALDKCVAMINTDMIGRCDRGKLSIGGNVRCPDLVEINEEENAKLSIPFTLSYDIEQYFFRSDQASFAMKRIPVIFYFTGEHSEYHKVGDEVDKINFNDLSAISRLATSVAWRAAHMPRTRYVPAGFED